MNPPNCFFHMKSFPEYRPYYESIFFGFLRTQGYSIEDIRTICNSNGTLTEGFEITEDKLNNAQFIDCEILQKNYPTLKIHCRNCSFGLQVETNNKSKIPSNIREELLLNIAQHDKRILDAIDPDKLVVLGQNENKDVRIYKELYSYLNDETSINNEIVIKTLKAIYNNNQKNPTNLKEITEKKLTNYFKNESIPEIKKLLEETEIPPIQQSLFDTKQSDKITVTKKQKIDESKQGIAKIDIEKEPIIILSSDCDHSITLIKSKYISIKERENEYHIYCDLNPKQLYIIPINDEMLPLLTRIAKDNKIRVIAENINLRNQFLIKHNLHIERLIPLDIICSEACVGLNNLSHSNYIEQYQNIEKRIGKTVKQVLSYVTLSMKTSKEIAIERTGGGFYKTKVNDIDRRDKCIFEVDVESFMKNLKYDGATYKEIYHQVAIGIEKQNERKVPFEIVEISEKFMISCSNDSLTKHRIHELITHIFIQTCHTLTKHDFALVKMIIHT